MADNAPRPEGNRNEAETPQTEQAPTNSASAPVAPESPVPPSAPVPPDAAPIPPQPQQQQQPAAANPQPAADALATNEPDRAEMPDTLTPVNQADANDQQSSPEQNPNPWVPTGLGTFGWFCMGFLFALPGVLITMFVVWRRDKPARNHALLWACIGLVTEVILSWILIAVMGFNPYVSTEYSTMFGDGSSESSAW